MTIKDDIKEMMSAWKLIEAEAKRQFPGKNQAEIYKICKGAMYHALGLTEGITETGKRIPIKDLGEGTHSVDIYESER